MKIQKLFFQLQVVQVKHFVLFDLDGDEPTEISRTGNFVDTSEFSQKFAPVWNANPELCVLLCLHQ